MFKRKRLIVLGTAALVFGCLVIFVRQQYMFPIIMYHSILPEAPKGDVLVVSVDTFEKQMSFFKRHNYNMVTLSSVKDYIFKKKKIPSRAVALTFDDGNKDNYTYAFPILKKYSFPATIFIIVSEVGAPGRLGWDEIKEMRDSGLITFGSHSFSHPFLDTIQSAEGLKKEIAGSKIAMEEKLGGPVELFSYPCGRFNDVVVQAVKDAGYQEAVVTNPGKKIPNDNPLALKRLRISENARNMFVFWFETTGYYNFIRENRHK